MQRAHAMLRGAVGEEAGGLAADVDHIARCAGVAIAGDEAELVPRVQVERELAEDVCVVEREASADTEPVEQIAKVALAAGDQPGGFFRRADRPFRGDRCAEHVRDDAGDDAVACAVACGDVEDGAGAVGVAGRKSAAEQRDGADGVAVDHGERAEVARVFKRVGRMIDERAIHVDAGMRHAHAADGEVGVEILIGGDAGKAGDGAERIVGEDCRKILQLGVVERVLRGGIGHHGIERGGGDCDLLGVAQSLLA